MLVFQPMVYTRCELVCDNLDTCFNYVEGLGVDLLNSARFYSRLGSYLGLWGLFSVKHLSVCAYARF